MLKWLGAILVVSCSSLLSMSRVLRSRQRIRALNALRDGLCLLRGELSSSAPPLPALLISLSRRAPQPAAELFGAAAEHLQKDDGTFRAAWTLALEETESLPLLTEERQALQTLGSVLGRSSIEEQCAELQRTEAKLKLFQELEEKERMKQSRVYAAVGTGAGAMLAILLL